MPNPFIFSKFVVVFHAHGWLVTAKRNDLTQLSSQRYFPKTGKYSPVGHRKIHPKRAQPKGA